MCARVCVRTVTMMLTTRSRPWIQINTGNK